MSYILDALRKSEEQRKLNRDRPAPLRTARIGKRSGRAAHRRTGGLILTGCIYLAVALLAAGWWWSLQDRGETAGRAENMPAAPTTPIEIQTTDAARSPDTLPDTSQVRIEQPAAEMVTPAENHDPVGDAVEPPVDLADLPPHLQAQIANMKFSGHVYSPTPDLRLIMIDNVVVREKETVKPGLTLAEITENGLIMETGSTRFRVDLF